MLVVWLILVVLVLVWWRTRPKHSNVEPPEFPGALPLIGHLPLILGDSATLLENIRKASQHCSKIGGAVVLHFGPHTDYLITDPDDAVIVGNNCLDKNFMYDFSKAWLGNGILTSPAFMWKRQRKMLNPTFSQQLMFNSLDTFNSQARRFVEQLACHDRQGPFDPQDEIRNNALGSICMTAMGLDISDETVVDRNYREAVDEALIIFQKRFKLPWLYFGFIFQWSNLRKRQDKYVQILHGVSNEVVQRWKLKNKQEATNVNFDENKDKKSKSVLELLMELSEEQGQLSYGEVREQVDTMIVAGYDTISLTVLFTLVLIGSHPEVQERLQNELKDVFGDSNRDVLKQDISRLTYMDVVIKESLRLYTPTPIVARHVSRDVKLKNYTLLAGKSCLFSIYGINRHPMWGTDADEFRPERWLDQSALPTSANAYLAFGVGRRNCIGKTYAMTSLKTTLAHFLRRYKVTADHSKLVVEMEFMLKPKSGYEIAIEARSI